MKKVLVLFIVSFMFCTSCLQKGGFAYIEGNIYKQGTNEPIEGAEVYLLRTHNSNQGEYRKATKSDKNGYYKIPYYYKFNSDYQYFVHVWVTTRSNMQREQMDDLQERYDFYFP